jgi:hypothetical protein
MPPFFYVIFLLALLLIINEAALASHTCTFLTLLGLLLTANDYSAVQERNTRMHGYILQSSAFHSLFLFKQYIHSYHLYKEHKIAVTLYFK